MKYPIVVQHRVLAGYIFRPWITLKDGSRRYARSYGLKAWRIPVYYE